jgi:dihydroorotate dehydrogenase
MHNHVANLRTKICGIEFPNPIWTAAGPTSASAELLRQAAEGGAGGLVTKTISVRPARVPIPNICSPFSGSLLNAELWSELDYRIFIDQVLPQIKALGLPVIVSVGYSADDLKILGAALEQSGLADVVEFSIHYIDKDIFNLQRTAAAIKDQVSVPVLAKLSPSIGDMEAVVRALDATVDGYVAINSVGPALDFDIETRLPVLGSEDGRGWLSGRAILPIGLHFVAALYSLTAKPVIGVGRDQLCRRCGEIFHGRGSGGADLLAVDFEGPAGLWRISPAIVRLDGWAWLSESGISQRRLPSSTRSNALFPE